MAKNEETLDKCPRRVLRVLICIRPIGSMLPVAFHNNMMMMTIDNDMFQAHHYLHKISVN